MLGEQFGQNIMHSPSCTMSWDLGVAHLPDRTGDLYGQASARANERPSSDCKQWACATVKAGSEQAPALGCTRVR